MMKSTFHSLITRLLRFSHYAQLPTYTGTQYISPKPSYISQFIGIYPASLSPETMLTNKKHLSEFGAQDSQEFTFWAWRDCGITCVKMILDAHKKAQNKTIMDLTHEGVSLGGYILYENKTFVDKGWFHHSLVALLKKYAVTAMMRKWQTAESVASDILANKMVILSVQLPGRLHISEDGSFVPKKNAKFGGHLLLATGVSMNGKKITGFYAHDPRGLANYQANTYIPLAVFNKIFTNRTIVVK